VTRLIRNRIDGIAEPLPNGETVLWSGRPAAFPFARQLFKLEWVAAWFAGLALWRGIEAWQDGAGLYGAFLRGLGQLPLAAAALLLLAGLGMAMARSTTYALTHRRIVFNVGVALPITFNLPLRYIDGAALRRRGGFGNELVLTLIPGSTIATFALWPNIRSSLDREVHPVMRNVPEPMLAALLPLLTEALQRSDAGQAAVTQPASAGRATDTDLAAAAQPRQGEAGGAARGFSQGYAA
jgi:hypothetical protein